MSFNPPDLLDTSPKYGDTVLSIALQSDGKILIGGEYSVFGAAYRSFIRLNPNGSLDTSLINTAINNPTNDIVVLPDDKFYLKGTNGVRRISTETD